MKLHTVEPPPSSLEVIILDKSRPGEIGTTRLTNSVCSPANSLSVIQSMGNVPPPSTRFWCWRLNIRSTTDHDSFGDSKGKSRIPTMYGCPYLHSRCDRLQCIMLCQQQR